MASKLPWWTPVAVLGGAAAVLLLVSPSEEERAHGIVLTDTDVTIEDWNAWMGWAPGAIDSAAHDGARDAHQILAHVLRQAFPSRQWPPAADDPIAPSWRELVHGLDRSLRQQDEDPADNVIQLHGRR